MASKKIEEVKRQTIELYDSLPIEEEARKARTDVRDKVFELNQSFFGYVAKSTFINNSSISYEDKYQSACMHFMECWWWYKWPVRYRTDLSFSVFFKPRIGEMIERELNEVKYSVRRSLCSEAGEQLGKHWGKVTYDDLKNVNLPADKMNSLKAIFGSLYWADLDEHTPYVSDNQIVSIFDYPDDNYNSIEDFLVHEMCEQETRFDDNQLKKLANEYNLDYLELLDARPDAEKRLYSMLREAVDFIDLQDTNNEASSVAVDTTYEE